ncbi:MAG: 50S ribosomal protein L6 [Candidatus Nanoarchaeia archaeon]|nr:50S ribosomal protein L6 [Candidatus Nanoarchaeia archaeon]
MISELKEKIIIPENVEVHIEEDMIRVKGPHGEVEREIKYPNITITQEDGQIKLISKNATKREKRMMGTFKSHISNMIKGVTENYEYTLKICSSHFPMSVSTEKDEVIIKNFLGEKVPRKATIIEGVEVKIAGDEIKVKSASKEKAGQTAANIEQICKVKKRDKRVFQDGIYIMVKAGKKI